MLWRPKGLKKMYHGDRAASLFQYAPIIIIILAKKKGRIAIQSFEREIYESMFCNLWKKPNYNFNLT